MKKLTLLFILFSAFPIYITFAAPGPQDERRIEEQKRENLKPTEVHYPKKKQPSKAAPLQQEDIMYIAELSLRKVTYGYDLCKVIVLLNGVENEYIALDAQATYLKEQKFLPKDLRDTFDPMKPLRRGVTAYVLSRALNIKGGIFLNIFRESQRYALKEMTYAGVMSSGNIHEILSGDELASTITRAVNYRGKR